MMWPETSKVIEEFTKEVAEQYKANLKRDGKSASGELIKSIKAINDSIQMADYWKYVEYGRKPGKFPPPNSIDGWRTKKNINFPGATFLISRSIAEKGIKAGHQYEEALDFVYNKFQKRIEDAITYDIDQQITKYKTEFL